MFFYFLFTLFLIFVGVSAHNETSLNETKPETKNEDPRCQLNCTFKENTLYSDTLKYFPKNCTTVCTTSALYIGYETDLTEKQLTDAFKNMKHLIGDLIVTRSKYKSGKFLASLETIDCENIGFFQWTLNGKMTEIDLPNLTNVSCRVYISANKNLTRLKLPNMIPVQSPNLNYTTIDVEILDSAPDFCITVQEMSNLMSNDYIEIYGGMGRGIHGKYCELSINSTSSVKTCDIRNSTMSNMDTGCVKVVGDVIIQEDDEKSVKKLESVESIFGSLIIEDTNLTNTNFLGKLKNIVSIKEKQPALLVEYNELLTNVSFPSLQRIDARLYVPVVFNNNSVELLKNPSFCDAIRSKMGERQRSWTVKVDDKVCEDVEKEAIILRGKFAKNSFADLILWALIFVTFVLRD